MQDITYSKMVTYMKVKKAVIPAAGLGTRMLPATKSIPKEMLPLGDKPSIQYIVEEAVAAGIEDILIITNRMKSAMEDYFDYHPELENRLRASGHDADADLIRKTADMANVTYLRQKQTLGLGHAIWCARRFVGDEPFAVPLGDDIMQSKKPVTQQLVEAYNEYECSTVGVKKVSLEAIGKYCSLKVEPLCDNILSVSDIIEKPRIEQVFSNYAILGRYVLTSDIFNILDTQKPGYGGEIQLTDALAVQARTSKMIAVDFEGRRFDTGNITGYLEAVLELSLQNPKSSEWLKKYIKERAKTL